MTDAPPELDRLIHQPTRLRIMVLLHRNRSAPFTWVQETLALTPGNLDSHAARLEAAGYVRRRRALTSDGFQVRLAITAEGDDAFRAYLAALRVFLDGEAGAAASDAPVERA